MKAVILAGGSGTRLWPVSTESFPKQFHQLVSDKTLLQETYNRLNFLNPEDIFIATNERYVSIITDQLPEIPEENILIEPAMRDTATCIGYAATVLEKRFGPDEVMAIIYADHLIQNTEEFQKKLQIAGSLAKKDNTLNIIEVKAKFPNTALGYVKIEELQKTIDGVEVYSFGGFHEKPDLETAKKFVSSFKYLWNTGFYVWKTSRILSEYKKHAPQTYENLQKIQESIGTDSEQETIQKYYSVCEKISIDFAIMEKVDKDAVCIIPADLGWSDIGTWDSLHKELSDENENVIKGDVKTINTENSLMYNFNSNQKVAVIDMHDIVIVNTDDALLVCPLRSSGKVKEILKQLHNG